MEQRKTEQDRWKDQKDEKSDAQLEREEEYQAIIEPDPLLAEVGKSNEKIGNPSEAQKVIPSKPC